MTRRLTLALIGMATCTVLAGGADTQPATPASGPIVNGNLPEVREFLAAVSAGDVARVRALAGAGGTLDRQPGLAGVALLRAIPAFDAGGQRATVEVLNELLRHGAVAQVADPGMLLWSACASGDREVVDVFWNAGIRPGDFATRFDKGDWPEVLAGRGGDVLTHLMLLSYPNAQFQFRRCGYPLSIFQAAAIGDDDRLAELIARGADVNAPSFASPLTIAAGYGHLSIVELLLKAGAHPTPDLMSGGQENWLQLASPLQAAAVNGHVAVVRRLLEAGADPSQPMPRSTTQTAADELRDRTANAPKAARPEWPAILRLLDDAAARNRPATRPH